jgi:hypothetical protein
MTTVLRSSRRTSYPALMLFLCVYLAALAIVVSPESFRSEPVLPGKTAAPSDEAPKGTP